MRQIITGTFLTFCILQEFRLGGARPLYGWHPYPWYTPWYGGRRVSYLSHLTRYLGNDMSERITAKSRLVSRVGHMIQDSTDYDSALAEYLGHVVDGDETTDGQRRGFYDHRAHPVWDDENDATDDEESDTDEDETS